VLRFEENTTASLFLPNDADRLRGISRQVLGPLRTYDEQRGTSLTQTLRVFLEENRSWVRAAERLYVHRQTLIARVSRIEKIIDRDLSSIEDTAECWLAVQAAIGCGDLEPNDTAPHAPGSDDA
jgi:purine catabolism regulator